MNRILLLAGVGVLALSLSACSDDSAPKGNGDNGSMTKSDKAMMNDTSEGPDKAFIMKAANSDMFEIESSKVAADRSQNAEVKSFAQQMVTDHSKSSSELKAIAGDKVPPAPDPATVARIEKIKSASDDSFDATYIDEQKAAHDEAVGLFEKFADSGEDAKLKEFAAKTLPVLKMHQDHVKALNAK